MRRLFALAAIVAVALAAFALLRGPAPQQGPVVLAASSMQDALNDAADAWAAQRSPRPVLSFAGTPALARQIEQGSPADIFISADEAWMNELARKGLIDVRSRADIAGNALVIVAAADSPANLPAMDRASLGAALCGGRLALADPDGVPAGRYARQALITADQWGWIRRQLAPTANVRAALALVIAKEAPLGVVYASDASAAKGRVRIVHTFPAGGHAPIRYPAALLNRSQNADARDFLQFLRSGAGQAILRRHGFTTP